MKKRALKRPAAERIHQVQDLTFLLQSNTYCIGPRQHQYDELKALLLSPMSREVIFVSGNPGCGKTATVKQLLSDLPVKFAIVNAAQMLRPGSVYRLLAAQFKEICSAKRKNESLARAAVQKRTLIIDEVDYLRQRLLYDIFELDARVVLIANSLNFLNEDPRLQSRGQNVRRVVFYDYSKEELVSIVGEKLSKAGQEQLIPTSVLYLAAQRIVQRGGDLRELQDALPRILAAADGEVTLACVNSVIGRQEISPLLFTAQETQCLACCLGDHECEYGTIKSRIGDPIVARMVVDSLKEQGLLAESEGKYRTLLDKRIVEELAKKEPTG